MKYLQMLYMMYMVLSVIRFRRRGWCFRTEFQGKISGPGWGRFQTHVRGISDAEKGAFQAQLQLGFGLYGLEFRV